MSNSYFLIFGSGSIGERHALNILNNFDKEVLVVSRYPKKSFREPLLNNSIKVNKISIEEINLYTNI